MAFKMKGSSYKMGGHKTKATMAYMKSPLEQAAAADKKSMRQAAADKKSPMEQKLGFMDKLSSVADAFDRYDGPFGANSIYDEYKNSKKNKREDMRREKLGHKQVKKVSAQGQPYHVTVDENGNEIKE